MASVAAVGLDFGGQTAVIAIAKKGGIEVATNEASQRETPLVVGFGQNERFLGEQAFVQMKSNFKNSIVFPIRFLGVKPGSSALDNEKKWIYSGIVESDNKIGFEVKYRGEKRVFCPEQIVAMSLQKMKQIAHSHGVPHNDMVITVPSYFTIDERKGLLDAAKIANVNVLKLLNESTSIALSYGIFRRNEFSNKPINVCFVDVGHCKTSVFVAAFTKEDLKLLNQFHDRNLGTRDLDWSTMEYYAEIVKKNTGVDILTKEKSRLRILDALEKQRKVLSANSEATINVDYIAEDYDLNHTLKREEYESINTKFFDRIKELLTQLKNEMKDLHSVEIIGGGTRIPYIQKIIQDIFKKPCSKTLHATECVARGAAVRSLMFHPLYKTGQFTIEENIYNPIRCKVSYPSLPEKIKEEGKSAEDELSCILFSKGCKMPAAKALELKKNDTQIDIDLFYDPEIPGYQNKLGQIKVQTLKSEAASFSNKTRLAINENGLLEIDKVELLEEYKIEPLKPQKEQKIGLGTKILNTLKFWNREQEDSVKGSVEVKSTDLKYDSNIKFGLTDTEIIKFAKEESEMLNFDRSVNETNESRNSLESYIYEIKGKLDDEYKALVSAEQKTKLLEILDSFNDWLYKNTNATKKDYQSKKDEIRAMVSQYEKRVNDWKDLRTVIEEFKSNVNQNDILEIVPPEKLDDLKKEIIEANKWIESYDKIQETESNLSHYTQEIRVRANDFLNKVVEMSKIQEIPEEKPKVEEVKPEISENKPTNPSVEKPTIIEEEKPGNN